MMIQIHMKLKIIIFKKTQTILILLAKIKFSKKISSQENENNSHERGYSFDAKVYHTNENIHLNYPEKNNYIGNRIRQKNIEKENNIYYNINNNINEENQIQKEISRNNQNYNYIITN